MKLLVSIFFFFTCAAAFSQDDGFRFGLKAGGNLANAFFQEDNTNTTIATTMRPSFYAGALVSYPLSDKFSAQAELLYVGNGMNYTVGSFTAYLSISQINLPVVVKYSIFDNAYVGLGGYAGFIVGVQGKIGEEDAASVTDEYNTIDGGIVGMMEYHLDIGLFFSLAYNWGLADISKAENNVQNNQAVQIGVGYRF